MPEITVGGLDLRYALEGPSEAPVVAFSNALGATLEMWDALLPALGGAYCTLRYDTRGHGGSATRDAETDIADLAGDLTGLLDALGIGRAHLVGLSLGGMTVQAAAIADAGRPLSVALMATAAHMPGPELWRARARAAREQGLPALADGTMARWFTPAFTAAEPETVAMVHARLVAGEAAGYAACCGAIGRLDLRPHLAGIAAPTLVVAGRADASTTPAMAEELCAGIPQAELVLLPRVAHMLAVERARAVGGYLRAFLDGAGG